MSQNDDIVLTSAIEDYTKQAEDYHFYNWELLELTKCEKEIKEIIDKYNTNIPVLKEINRRLLAIPKFPPHQLIQDIDELIKAQQTDFDIYYSLDGQQFTNIDDAIARNEMLQNMMYDQQKAI